MIFDTSLIFSVKTKASLIINCYEVEYIFEVSNEENGGTLKSPRNVREAKGVQSEHYTKEGMQAEKI